MQQGFYWSPLTSFYLDVRQNLNSHFYRSITDPYFQTHRVRPWYSRGLCSSCTSSWHPQSQQGWCPHASCRSMCPFSKVSVRRPVLDCTPEPPKSIYGLDFRLRLHLWTGLRGKLGRWWWRSHRLSFGGWRSPSICSLGNGLVRKQRDFLLLICALVCRYRLTKPSKWQWPSHANGSNQHHLKWHS